MTNDERRRADPSDLEGGDTEQTWGQGEGRHEPTIPESPEHEDESPPASSYADGMAHGLDDPDLPLTREDEGMDR